VAGLPKPGTETGFHFCFKSADGFAVIAAKIAGRRYAVLAIAAANGWPSLCCVRHKANK
jgi:hypothetical protein